MDFDNSWDAVMKPGKATTAYFDVLGKTKFEAGATSYSKTNAWWLAELCRLVYRQNIDEDRDSKGPIREAVLSDVNLHEASFFNQDGSQASLVTTTGASGVRFAALVLRGTDTLMDWAVNFKAVPATWRGKGKVHKGWSGALEKIWDKVVDSLAKNVPADCPLFITGHSLGAALAMLAASLNPPRALYTYGCPRVGDDDFAATLSSVPYYRVVNNRDVVTTVPPPLPFHHLGELHYITHDGGMLVKPDDDTVARDRLKRDNVSFFSRDWHKIFTDAPEPVADHAPVNYVAHLERQV